MGILRNIRLRFSPPRLQDPEFGPMRFMFIPHAPARSYWEAEWRFPPTNTDISIGVGGDENGPRADARAFYLALPAQFEQLMARVRPALDKVFQQWYSRPMANDLWQDVKLAGFGVDDLDAKPPKWDVSFEAIGEKWLGITVPIDGDRVLDAVVDT